MSGINQSSFNTPLRFLDPRHYQTLVQRYDKFQGMTADLKAVLGRYAVELKALGKMSQTESVQRTTQQKLQEQQMIVDKLKGFREGFFSLNDFEFQRAQNYLGSYA